jgi:hypothetical protein
VFDTVFASDRRTNLSRDRKRQVLVDDYGERGFGYAAKHYDDVPVWNASGKAILGNVYPALQRHVTSWVRAKSPAPPESRTRSWCAPQLNTM